MKEKIHTLYKSVLPCIHSDGKNTTPVSYIDVYRCTQKEMLLPDIPNPYLFFVVHGNMRLHSIEGIFEYGSGQYLISAIDHPRTAEIRSASQTEPFIALLIEFSVDDVISVMLDIDGDLPERLFDETAAAAMTPCTDEKMTELLIRLLRMTPTELSFMGKHLKREIIFNIITGAYGKPFIQHIVNMRQAGDIYYINSWIKQNYKVDFSVEDLAEQSNMSLSSFHQKFKSAVGMGPLQCQKKLRLTEARRLMLDKGANVTDAAMEVGYESVSQFIRDYRRMFGRSPQKDVQEIQDRIGAQEK